MGICGYYGPSGDQQGEYESFERAEAVISDFYQNHDATRLFTVPGSPAGM
jgi:hypothetical protein